MVIVFLINIDQRNPANLCIIMNEKRSHEDRFVFPYRTEKNMWGQAHLGLNVLCEKRKSEEV